MHFINVLSLGLIAALTSANECGCGSSGQSAATTRSCCTKIAGTFASPVSVLIPYSSVAVTHVDAETLILVDRHSNLAYSHLEMRLRAREGGRLHYLLWVDWAYLLVVSSGIVAGSRARSKDSKPSLAVPMAYFFLNDSFHNLFSSVDTCGIRLL